MLDSRSGVRICQIKQMGKWTSVKVGLWGCKDQDLVIRTVCNCKAGFA